MDRRPWFQFRLSTILFIVVICALSLAWWGDHVRLSVQLQSSRAEQHRAEAEAAKAKADFLRYYLDAEMKRTEILAPPLYPATRR